MFKGRKVVVDTFMAGVIRDFGNIDQWNKLTTAQLESLGKRLQREVNRRVDVAASKKYMRELPTFKVLEKSGGKISLSKGWGWDAYNMSRVLVKNQTAQGRRAYLVHEIQRAQIFLTTQTSTVTGYREAKKAQIEGVRAALVQQIGAQRADDFIRRLAADQKANAKFWALFHDFYDKHYPTYVSRGSEEVLDAVSVFITEKAKMTSQEKIKEYGTDDDVDIIFVMLGGK